MPKTARQLDKEIAEALSGGSRTSARFTIHGARKGKNKVKYTDSAVEADRIARRWANENFLITVLEQDPETHEYTAVMVGNRKDGEMVLKTLSQAFARALAH